MLVVILKLFMSGIESITQISVLIIKIRGKIYIFEMDGIPIDGFKYVRV
jgi:hypothetical protein